MSNLTTSQSNSSGSSESSSRSARLESLPLHERDLETPGIGPDSTMKEEAVNDSADRTDDRPAMILDQPDFEDSVQSVNPRMKEYEQRAKEVLIEMLATGGESDFSSIYIAVIELFRTETSPLLPFTEAFLEYITRMGKYDQDYVASLAVEYLPINQDLANELALLLEISHEDLDITLASIAAKRVQKAELDEILASQPLHRAY
ncbi:hypothetical protein HDU76_004586 [Blyttiomyces sp. JEL0837]|nr:hypothetical protein HDU76_004586 [Blyttiomyces sp. JEL0837]